MKIVTIVGARPQFIKAAAFSRKAGEIPGFEEIIIHTGQHYDDNMSEVFFREMDIPQPHFNLAIHGTEREAVLANMQREIEELLQKIKPGRALVYGDTNSTLAGARAAKQLGIPLAHVEAGLRSFDTSMPEEVNRVETDQLSDFLFVPSEGATQNLLNEGLVKHKIHEVGDIMYDAVLHYSQKAPAARHEGAYILLTLHRQENTDDKSRLRQILEAVNAIAEKHKVVFPIHPRTRKMMTTFGLSCKAQMIDPVGYLEMIALVKNCTMVFTDSGGLQKEAFYLQKFCVTLRKTTEWTELVDLGANTVCSNPAHLMKAYEQFQSQEFKFPEQPYGKGDTAEKIIEVLHQTFR